MKKLLKTFVLIMMVITLTGCMKINMNVEVQEDLSTKISTEILMEEKLLTMGDEDPDEALKQMQDDVLSEEQLKDAKITPIKKTIDGAQWLGLSIEGIANTQEGQEFISVKKEKIDGKEQIVLTLPMDDLKDEMDADTLDDDSYSIEQIKKLGMEMNVTVKMPGKVTSKIGQVKDNTVIIDLLDLMINQKSNDVVITSDISNDSNTSMIVAGVAIVAVIAVGVFVFIKNKSKKTTEEEIIMNQETENSVTDSTDEE